VFGAQTEAVAHGAVETDSHARLTASTS